MWSHGNGSNILVDRKGGVTLAGSLLAVASTRPTGLCWLSLTPAAQTQW
jgi:hypothetical protein